jgi:Fe2+ or Zn2+ uptake regulation protein
VREVESDLFEQLKRQVERDTGIGITVARVEIGGYCDACRAKADGR